MNFFKKCFWSFLPTLETTILINTSAKLVNHPASTSQKDAWTKHRTQTKTLLPLAKNTQNNRKENPNYVHAFTFHGSSHQKLFVNFTRKCSAPVVKKPFSFINDFDFGHNDFIIEELFVEHLCMAASKVRILFWIRFYVLFKVRMLQKGFSKFSFTWSVKWRLLLKSWNNHSRDWINNFPLCLHRK